MNNTIIENLKNISQKPYFPKILVALGIAFMLLILFCDENDSNSSESNINNDFTLSGNYIGNMEERLSDILGEIKGVGKNSIIVNYSSTEEYVYAEEIHQGTNQSENNYVIFDGTDSKEALVKKIKVPTISGIVIVCEGGDDPKICEKIYKAVSTAFNVPTNRIYVAEMK